MWGVGLGGVARTAVEHALAVGHGVEALAFGSVHLHRTRAHGGRVVAWVAVVCGGGVCAVAVGIGWDTKLGTVTTDGSRVGIYARYG
eukprot:22065-Amorphochlora_amoeboformis.AAC.2